MEVSDSSVVELMVTASFNNFANQCTLQTTSNPVHESSRPFEGRRHCEHQKGQKSEQGM
jgi:hypothetical protein